ncbi:MAG TPA: RloB family protein [Arachidicoccus sp.]|nr:RloB family protein [Arachidicoccus sp.]
MRRLRKKRFQTRPAYAFVVDGDTEIWYLQMLKRNEPKINVRIDPQMPNKKKLEEQFNFVAELANKEYSKIFWIVDFDAIIKESKEVAPGKKTSIRQFMDFRSRLLTKFTNVVVIVNNPCLEYWLLLHFENTSKHFDNCSKSEERLKRYLKDYEKTWKYFTKQDNDIYLKLKPYIKTAIQNATRLGQFDEYNPLKSICEMAQLFSSFELKNCIE